MSMGTWADSEFFILVYSWFIRGTDQATTTIQDFVCGCKSCSIKPLRSLWQRQRRNKLVYFRVSLDTMVIEKGVYKVTESGSEFQFGTKEHDLPTTPEKFLDNFRYVLCCVWVTECCASHLPCLRRTKVSLTCLLLSLADSFVVD